MKQILLAGATGALGQSVLRELDRRGYPVRALARDPAKLRAMAGNLTDPVTGDVTRPETLAGICEGVDTVISTVGASLRMGLSRRGESFRAIDYGGNRHLLDEALRSGVRRFIYISLFNGETMPHLEYARAHEDFVRDLAKSGVEGVVIRPTGFFSAFGEILKMARRGRAISFGDGSARTNPVHEDDIAIACADAVEGSDREIAIGGPTTFTRREITELAFAALGAKPRITTIPAGLFRAMLIPLRPIDRRLYDLFAFFAEVGTTDVVAPARGRKELAEYFQELAMTAR